MWSSETAEIAGTDWRKMAREFVICFAERAEPGESAKALIGRAARKSGRPFSRLWNLYYGKGSPSPDELASLKRDLEKRRIQRAWADIEMDKKLAAMTAEHERLKQDVRDLGRAISTIRRAVAPVDREDGIETLDLARRRRATDR